MRYTAEVWAGSLDRERARMPPRDWVALLWTVRTARPSAHAEHRGEAHRGRSDGT
jgi:hypothetical protein